jgi:hypothetical protein
VSRRAQVREADLRFFLAVLLNAQRRSDALGLIAAYAPGAEPARQTATWLRELSNTTVRIQVGDVPFEPSVLGIPSFGADAEPAIAEMLTGRERSWTAAESALFRSLRAAPALEPLFV